MRAEHLDQFVPYDLYDLLTRGKGREHFLAHGLLLYLFDELLDNFEMYVGFQ